MRKPHYYAAVLGDCIGEHETGKGYTTEATEATEAVKIINHVGFGALGLRRIEADVNIENREPI